MTPKYLKLQKKRLVEIGLYYLIEGAPKSGFGISWEKIHAKNAGSNPSALKALARIILCCSIPQIQKKLIFGE